ncbi:MAG: mechanosensitive ion channel [Proteobacteria bacterium]|nr:mechanosensitive ion channel [Pseudomonadota bacterium]
MKSRRRIVCAKIKVMQSAAHYKQLIYIVIIGLIMSPIQAVLAQEKTATTKQLEQSFKSLQEKFQQQNHSKKSLNDLDTQSAELLQQINQCKQRNEKELNRLTQAREIDVLEDSSIQSTQADQEKPEPDYPGTEEIDKQIKNHTKELINCRLMASRLDQIRQSIFSQKRNLWIQGIKVRHKIWQFIYQPLDFGQLQLQRIIPTQWIALGFIAIALLYYFLLIFKHRVHYFKSYDKKPQLETLKDQFKSLALTFCLPLIAAFAYAWLVEPPFQWLLLLMVLALLIRDGCLFLSLPLLPKSFNPKNIKRFIWVSTGLIILAAFGWNAIDYRQYNFDQWLSSQSLFITPLFITINILFIIASYYWYHVLKPYKDRMIAIICCAIAFLTLLFYVATYAKLAQYLLVLNLGGFVLHLAAKNINGLRKILLVHRIRQLKKEAEDNSDDGQDEDMVYSFPFWISLFISIIVGVAGLGFMIWLGGAFQETYQQLKLIFTDGFELGSLKIVPSSLLIAILISVVLILILSRIRHGIEYQWFNKSRLKKGPREVVSMLFWYIGITVVVFIGLSIAGFDISNLTVIAGALSVGIGFGLKNIVSNFVSGIILLFERPVKPGDWVEVGDTIGFIQKIKMRATNIKTLDNSEVLVPNSELLSHHVTNWNLSNSIGRIIIKVGVAYGSDTEQVKETLLKVAKNHNQVVNRSNYKPQVHFRSFGDSSLNFELRVMIYNIKNLYQVESDLNFAVDKAFREAGVTIPFPQRDLHVIEPLQVDQNKDQENSQQDRSDHSKDSGQQKNNDSTTEKGEQQGEDQQRPHESDLDESDAENSEQSSDKKLD